MINNLSKNMSKVLDIFFFYVIINTQEKEVMPPIIYMLNYRGVFVYLEVMHNDGD